jgi:hypothetical protein
MQISGVHHLIAHGVHPQLVARYVRSIADMKSPSDSGSGGWTVPGHVQFFCPVVIKLFSLQALGLYTEIAFWGAAKIFVVGPYNCNVPR